jgi:hypothetical protein
MCSVPCRHCKVLFRLQRPLQDNLHPSVSLALRAPLTTVLPHQPAASSVSPSAPNYQPTLCTLQQPAWKAFDDNRLRVVYMNCQPLTVFYRSPQHRLLPLSRTESVAVFAPVCRLPACTPGSFGAWPRCADAPPGYAAPNYGMSTPNRCPAGRFAVLPGSTVCDQ